jgi:hypothetical protein
VIGAPEKQQGKRTDLTSRQSGDKSRETLLIGAVDPSRRENDAPESPLTHFQKVAGPPAPAIPRRGWRRWRTSSGTFARR